MMQLQYTQTYCMSGSKRGAQIQWAIITSLAKGGYVLVVLVCLFICLFVNKITPQVMNGLGWNFMKES